MHVACNICQRTEQKTPRTLHFIYSAIVHCVPIPVASQTKASVCGRSLDGNACSNPAGDMDLSLVGVFVMSSRGLCDGLITRPDESYRVRCIWVWSGNFFNEEVQEHWGCQSSKKKCAACAWFCVTNCIVCVCVCVCVCVFFSARANE